jgi:hypothetical protein
MISIGQSSLIQCITLVIKAAARTRKAGCHASSFFRVKYVPVNYAIRSSGPVTPSPPAALGMASEPAFICQADALAGISARSSPPLFQRPSLSLFPPSPSCTAPFVPQASASSTCLCKPLFSQADTTWPVRECLSGTAGSHSLDAFPVLTAYSSEVIGTEGIEGSTVSVKPGKEMPYLFDIPKISQHFVQLVFLKM